MSEFNQHHSLRPDHSQSGQWESLANLPDLTPVAPQGSPESGIQKSLPDLTDTSGLGETHAISPEGVSEAELTEDQLGIMAHLENSLRDILNDPRTKEALENQRATAGSLDLAIEEMSEAINRLAEDIQYSQVVPVGAVLQMQELVGGFGRLIALDEESARSVRKRFSDVGDVASEAWVSAKRRFGDEEAILGHFEPKFTEIHKLSTDLSELSHRRDGLVVDELGQKVNQLYGLLGELSAASGNFGEALRLMVDLANDAAAIGQRSRDLLGQINDRAEAMLGGAS